MDRNQVSATNVFLTRPAIYSSAKAVALRERRRWREFGVCEWRGVISAAEVYVCQGSLEAWHACHRIEWNRCAKTLELP